MEPDDLSQEPGSADRGQDCRQFLAVMLSQPRVKARLSDEHFSVDGTLIEASASMKSFRPSRGSGASCRAKCRAKLQGRNAFDRSACVHDRSARQALSQVGWPEQPPLLHGAPADGEPQHLDCRRGTDPRQRHCGAGGGPEHDRAKQIKGGTASPSVPTWPMTCGLWSRNFKLGTSPRTSRPSATSGSAANRARLRSTGAPPAISAMSSASACASASRKAYGWVKTTGNLAKTRHRGLARVGWFFTFTATAYNLVRLPKLLAAG